MKQFIEKVLNRFAGDITDRVFLMIQNDPELMREYLRLLSNVDLDNLNRDIGRAVRTKFNLDNIGRCHDNLQSSLINSYEKHKIKC